MISSAIIVKFRPPFDGMIWGVRARVCPYNCAHVYLSARMHFAQAVLFIPAQWLKDPTIRAKTP